MSFSYGAGAGAEQGITMMVNPEVEAKIQDREWFYRFHLPSGQTTKSYAPDEVLVIHDTREQMMFQVLAQRFRDQWQSLRCLDLACHEGFFAHKLALKGCREVVGVDARPEHVEHAELIRAAYALDNLSFRVGDVQTLTAQQLGRFDVTLLFGILYHLEETVRVLRLAQATTEHVCLIETQVAPNMTGQIDWGSYRYTKEMVGCLAIVDEADELAAENQEANLTRISLVPSLPALLWLLKAVGFKSGEVVAPPAGAYEQLAAGKRVVVAAYNS